MYYIFYYKKEKRKIRIKESKNYDVRLEMGCSMKLINYLAGDLYEN